MPPLSLESLESGAIDRLLRVTFALALLAAPLLFSCAATSNLDQRPSWVFDGVLPADHPALRCFLGVPFFTGSTFSGSTSGTTPARICSSCALSRRPSRSMAASMLASQRS